MGKRSHHRRFGIAAFFILLLLFAVLNPIIVCAEDYPPAYPLPALTGNKIRDLINVARSQVGYTSSDSNHSVYWVWAGSVGESAAWCTEFVCWCTHMAQIPESTVPLKWSSSGLRKFFSKNGAFFSVNEGCSSNTCNCRKLSSETISVDEILPGDILLLDTNNNMDDGPDHTALVEKYENGILYTIEGNVGGKRYADGTKGYAKVSLMQTNSSRFGRIHGICRPSSSGCLKHILKKYPKVDSTCTKKGTEEYWKCMNCGLLFSDSAGSEQINSPISIALKQHTKVIDKAVSATCTETGKTEGQHCSVCNKIFVAQKTVPAKGHTKVTDPPVAPTYTESGKTEGSHCSVCGLVLIPQEDIPPVHIPGDINNDGMIDGRDAIHLMKYLAGETDENTGKPFVIYKECADLNNDSKVDEKDLLHLMQFLAVIFKSNS